MTSVLVVRLSSVRPLEPAFFYCSFSVTAAPITGASYFRPSSHMSVPLLCVLSLTRRSQGMVQSRTDKANVRANALACLSRPDALWPRGLLQRCTWPARRSGVFAIPVGAVQCLSPLLW